MCIEYCVQVDMYHVSDQGVDERTHDKSCTLVLSVLVFRGSDALPATPETYPFQFKMTYKALLSAPPPPPAGPPDPRLSWHSSNDLLSDAGV